MLNWSDIDTVMFDMDGTLLDLHYDNYFWEQLVPTTYGARIGLSAQQAWDQVREQYSAVQGTLNWYCMDFWSRHLELDIRQMKHDTRDRISLRPFVPELLHHLKSSDKKVMLVTNAHPHSLSLKMEQTGLASQFHCTISSHTLGKAKEHEGFWTALRAQQDYDPARTVLFDDNLQVLRCARNEGIRHLYAIEQPDSQRPPVALGEFPQIRHFRDLLP